MNGYQNKRVLGCLRLIDKLTLPEKKFIASIKDKPVVSWPKQEPEGDYLKEKQNHALTQICQRYRC